MKDQITREDCEKFITSLIAACGSIIKGGFTSAQQEKEHYEERRSDLTDQLFELIGNTNNVDN